MTNDLGQTAGTSTLSFVVGAHGLEMLQTHGFRTAPNSPIHPGTDDLENGSASSSLANSINHAGQVTGLYEFAGPPPYTVAHAFRTAPNLPINPATDDLGTLGTGGTGTDLFTSSGLDINSPGQVAGFSEVTGGFNHGFRTAPDRAINPATDDLGTLGGNNSQANAINDAGQVTGLSDTLTPYTTHAFRTVANAKINPLTDDLGILATNGDSRGLAINNLGVVVGYGYVPATFGDRAFLYDQGPMLDLNSLIPANSGVTLLYGTGINDFGQIAAFGLLGAEYHAFRLDPITPVIVSRFPAAGATGVTSSEVDVTFDRQMNAATLNASTFTLRAAGAASNTAASIYASGAAASLIPSAALVPGTTYTVTIAGTVADSNGVAFGNPASWTFTTAGSLTPPAIVSRFPAAGAAGVTNPEVDVTFNRAMNAATLNSSTFTLRAAGAAANVTAAIYVSGAAASLVPSSPLAAGTTYTVTLAATVADTNGVPLGTAATWTFTTAGSLTPPAIVSRFPAAGAAGATNQEVDVTFNRAMNAATLNLSTFTLRAAGATSDVSGTIYVLGAAASLVPSAALAASTIYTVTIAGTVTDANGIALGSQATWTFTTGNTTSPE